MEAELNNLKAELHRSQMDAAGLRAQIAGSEREASNLRGQIEARLTKKDVDISGKGSAAHGVGQLGQVNAKAGTKVQIGKKN